MSCRKKTFVCAMLALSTLLYAQELAGEEKDIAQNAAEAAEATDAAGAADAGTDADGGNGGGEAAAEPPRELTPEEKAAQEAKKKEDSLRELEIKISTLRELAEWASSLGLGEGGSREDIAGRIRQFYQMPLAGTRIKAGDRIITIEEARTTEYFTLESVNEEYARLSGGVALSLKDGDAVHRIRAQEILFNRSRNVLTATGGVEYEKDENGSIERFKGDSITINLDTWVGDFINTEVERAMEGADTAYKFSGQVISKTDSDTTILKKAKITNAATDEPYWSLNASRLWLMPGSDWAILNAVLKVGEVPVFWLPFFVYPMSEVIFHPVLGSRTREGYYFQSTTYIIGRSVPDESNTTSISKILGSNKDMEQVREGLFLRTTKKREINPNDKILSILLDAYVNLGFYTGVDFKYPKTGVMNNIDFSFGLGWTRTVFDDYTPFDLADNWDEDWNHSNLFGADVPFRYRFDFSTGFSGRFGTLTLKFPFYSDPFINTDVYINRSEQMDWMQLIQGGMQDVVTSTTNDIGSYQWSLAGNPSISMPFLAPYISNISISSISTFMNFVPSTTRSDISSYSPERQFFIPDKLTAYSVSGSLSGTPLTIGGSTSSTAAEEAKNPLEGIGVPISPWKDEEKEVETKQAAANKGNAFTLSPPELKQAFTLAKNNALRFSTSYSLSPSSATELQYYKAKTLPEDIDWGDFQSMLTNVRTDGSITFNLSEANNSLFSTSLGFSGSYQWQEHYNINLEELSEDEVNSLYLQDYTGRQWNINGTYNFTLSPFYWSSIFKSTNFQYSLGSLVAKSTFNSTKWTEAGKPRDAGSEFWDIKTPKWERDPDTDLTDISTHRVTANLGMSILDKTQSLSFYADLPPRYQLYSANATARVWITETNANMQIQEDTIANREKDAETRGYDYHYINGYLLKPLYLTETLNIGSSVSFKVYGSYDPENSEWTNASVSLKLWNFNTAFTAIKTYKYYVDPSSGWKQESGDGAEQKLYPRDITASFSISPKFTSLFGGYLDLSSSISTNLTLDLQRYTYSRFTLNLSLTFGITKFLDITMGAAVENKQIYWYLRKLPIWGSELDDFQTPDSIESNFFVDLANSFRFDNDDLRRKSGFKLKSFNFSLDHHLGDWDAKLTVNLTPELDSTISPPEYRFRTDITFLVQWVPLSEIKTEMYYEDGEFVKKSN